MNSSFFNISQQQAQQSYTDLNALQSIRQSGREDKNLALKQVAQQFEAMFIQMMLKSMRSANDVFAKDNPLNSFESQHYKEMYDNQLSLSLSGKNLGIADALYRQLQRDYLSSGQQTDKPLPQKSVPLQSLTFTGLSSSKSQRIYDAKALNTLNSREDFINLVAPYAKKVAADIGVDYRVLVAQAALETGWGEHVIRDKYGNQSFNLFNIKADSRWSGKSVAVPTMEYKEGVMQKEVASFRRYHSIAESFKDYHQFIQQPRYKKALEAVAEPEAFLENLQQAGYATDPFYAKKINQIMNDHLL